MVLVERIYWATSKRGFLSLDVVPYLQIPTEQYSRSTYRLRLLLFYKVCTPYSTRYCWYHPQLHRVNPAEALVLAGVAITGESWSTRRNDKECAMPNGPLVVHASYLLGVKVLYWSNNNKCLCQTWPSATAGVLLVHFRCNIQQKREKWNRGGDIIEAVASREEKPRDKHRTAVCIKIFVKIYSKKGIVEKRRKVIKNKKGK